MKKIANKHARQYVIRKQPFVGSSLFAAQTAIGYVVYSHKPFPPMLICIHVEGTDLWFANEDYSESRHMIQCRPDMYNPEPVTMTWHSSEFMEQLHRRGYMRLVRERIMGRLPAWAA